MQLKNVSEIGESYLKKIIFRFSNKLLQKDSGTGLWEIYCSFQKCSLFVIQVEHKRPLLD